jgi:H+-translocating NAD(P) transhydrogenase
MQTRKRDHSTWHSPDILSAARHVQSFKTKSHPWNHRKHAPAANYAPYKQSFATASNSSVVVPYTSLTVGIPRETFPNERRVAITPQNVVLLLKKGFLRVLIESGAGAEAQFTDEAYRKAGAIIVEKDVIWSQSDILLKVRAPGIEDGPLNEVNSMRDGTTVISFLYPAQNKPVVEALAARGITSFAMDKIPRISRAQVFDALRLASIWEKVVSQNGLKR